MFGKPKMTADEIVKAIASLSDEERKKIYEQAFTGSSDEKAPEQKADAATESTEAPTEGKAGDVDVSTDAVVEETTPVQETIPAEETQTAESETVVETAVSDGNEGECEPEKQEEVDDAQEARITAMEGEISELKELISKIVGSTDSDFGQKAQPSQENDDYVADDSRIMDGYYKNKRNYK